MVKKIISVDLNFPEKTEPPIENETPPEVEEQKDEYAEVKEDANIIETPPEPPKPKRKAAAKKPVVEPVVEAEAEPVKEVEPLKEAEPVKETIQPKSEDTQKVKCQHCNKEMTLKSLKYSHSKNCLGLKKTIEKVSNEKVSQKTAPPAAPPPPPPSPIPYTNIPIKIKEPQPGYIFPSSEKPSEHPRVARMKVLKEKYNNLVQNAFNV